jgi:hypothetical protein
MKYLKKLVMIIALIGMLVSIPITLYIWLVWGWYDGFIMAFNALLNDPKSASDFAYGIIKVLLGSFLGVLTGTLVFWFSFVIGLLGHDDRW